MFKERIVEFSDGTYGIQVQGGWFNEPKFLWLLDQPLSFGRKEKYFKRYCRDNNLARVKEIFDKRQKDKEILGFTPLKANLADYT